MKNSKKKYAIKAINNIPVVNLYVNLSIRGNHPKKWKNPTSCKCAGCKSTIEVGEAYFYFAENMKYCIGCVDFEEY